jgi:hypothetical protein
MQSRTWILAAVFAALLCGTPDLAPAGTVLSPDSLLDAGYLHMYNLRFPEARRQFRLYQESHPEDPIGPCSEAASFLFSEFNRLGILRSELFTDDEKFRSLRTGLPDQEAKEGFEHALAKSDQLAQGRLRRSPGDADALFATMMNLGMRADYAGLIEKRYVASLSYIKKAGILGEKLLSAHPAYYDGYLALGIENYLLGLRPAPVRWMLRLYGAQTDKRAGIEKLTLTAERGHYLLPYARLLLSFAAMREGDSSKARVLLEGLSKEFPNNPLYARELARLRD